VQKRGQAAMEFLMTYGWALLVVLVAIGALAFFGVLNPSKFLPQACALGPGLACEDFKITATNKNIYINVRNGLGRDLDVFAIYIDKKSPSGNDVCGGMTGFVALPLPPPVDSFAPIFRDGTARSLKSEQNGNLANGFEDGLNCDVAFGGNAPINCCTNGSPGSLLPIVICGVDGASRLPNPCMCVSQDCYASSPLPKTGSKFNSDIVIVYKEWGSNIIHQRIGKLSAQIE